MLEKRTPEITTVAFFFWGKGFYLSSLIISVWLVHTMDNIPHPSFFYTNILQDILSDLRFWTRSVTAIFSTSWKEKIFHLRKCKGDWRFGNWFIRHCNFSCSTLLLLRGILLGKTCKRQVRNLLVSLGILADMMQLIFSLQDEMLFQASVKYYWMIFLENLELRILWLVQIKY